MVAAPPEGGRDLVPVRNGEGPGPRDPGPGSMDVGLGVFPAIGGRGQGLGPYRDGWQLRRLAAVR